MAWTNPAGHVSDDLYAALRAHFDEFEIVELGVTAAALIGMGKFGLAFELLEREDSCPIQAPVRTTDPVQQAP
jgi:hypothetical protein